MDLSGESFVWLLTAIKKAAAELYKAQEDHAVHRFPVAWMRKELREALGTCPPGVSLSGDTGAPQFKVSASGVLEQFVDTLQQHAESELLLGFPSAPFILPLAAQDHGSFLSYVEQSPDHAVLLRRSGQAATAEWTLSPRDDATAYRLTFKLPEHVEDWISGIAEKERQRTLDVKTQFLASITIYRMNGSGVRPTNFDMSQVNCVGPDGGRPREVRRLFAMSTVPSPRHGRRVLCGRLGASAVWRSRRKEKRTVSPRTDAPLGCSATPFRPNGFKGDSEGTVEVSEAFGEGGGGDAGG